MNNLIHELKSSWDDVKSTEVLQELTEEFFASDRFCEKPIEERQEAIFRIKQMSSVIRYVGEKIHSE